MMKRCPMCGKEYPESNTFCAEDGETLQRMASEPALTQGVSLLPPSVAKQTNKYRLLWVAGLGMFGVGVLGWWLYGRSASVVDIPLVPGVRSSVAAQQRNVSAVVPGSEGSPVQEEEVGRDGIPAPSVGKAQVSPDSTAAGDTAAMPAHSASGILGQTAVPDALEGWIALCSQRELTEADLSGRSEWELQLMRNGPYARHGYRFHTTRITAYFTQQPWYHPTTGDMDRVSTMLSAIERKNTAFLLLYEKKRHSH